MQRRGLEAFVAVAEERSFRRAGDQLGIVGPAVSQLVRRMERDLGVVLFERSSRYVSLTDVGERLLPAARRALAAYGDFAREARAAADGSAGVLRVGSTVAMGDALQRLTAAFAARHPDIRLDVRRSTTPQKVQALLRGDLDIAFLRAPPPLPELSVFGLWQDRLVAVVPARGDAAHRPAEPFDPRGVRDLPLLLNPAQRNPEMRRRILAICAAHDLRPQLGPASDSSQETLARIAAGTGWTMLLEPRTPRDTPGVTLRPLTDPEAVTDVALAWRAIGATPGVEALVAVARDVLAVGGNA